MRKLDTGLIARLIISIIVVLNMISTINGTTPLNLDENNLYVTISTIVTIVTWARGFWKNNNFTEEARQGQILIDTLKQQKTKSSTK